MKRGTGKLIAAKAKARREGWAKWIQSEADERALLVGYYFSRQRADHVCEFGPKYLRFTGSSDWYGKPFELMPWQEERLMRPLFGWVHDSDEWGRTVRRFRRAYVHVPKKNGKSPTGAYVALYMLAADGRNRFGCHGYSASTDKEQATIVHGDACNMIEASPKLAKILKVNRTAKNIAHRAANGFYRVLSSCPRRNEGWNAQFIIADELHKWYGRELWDALKWAFASRSEPLLFAITTAGDDPESVCFEQYEYAKEIIDGRRIDLQYFPLIYEALPEDDPADPQTWRKANPSLGHVIKLSTFKSDHDEATATRGSYDSFKQLRLNIWGNVAESWLNPRRWDAGPAARKRRKTRCDCFEEYSADDLAGQPSWGGLDLALTTDLTALVLVVPDLANTGGDTDVFRTIAHFWLPEATADLYAKKVRYREWADQGWLTLTPGSEADFDMIRLEIIKLAEKHALQQLLFDPMFAHYLTQRLELESGIARVEFPQRLAVFAQPCAMFERLVLSKRLRHRGNPVLTWCLRNAKVRTDDNGNMRPVRPKRGDHRRIDGLVAAVMGLAGALKGESGRPDYYDTNEPEWI